MIVKFSLILKLKILIINKKRPMAATIGQGTKKCKILPHIYYHSMRIIILSRLCMD